MKAGADYEIRGWCPGALRPMPSGDGLIVRVRPRLGAFSPSELSELASATEHFGNGQIDLTRRANLQIRGVSENSLAPLLQVLGRLDLLDANVAAEAARNLLISPLSGIDPAEVLDMRPVARELMLYVAEHAEVWQLPGKFGFILDGNGSVSLAAERADIRLLAVPSADGPLVLIGFDGVEGPDWLGAIEPERSARAASLLVHAFRAHGHCSRVRELDRQQRAAIKSALADITRPLGLMPAHHPSDLRDQLGVLDLPGCAPIAAIALPFGRIDAGELHSLATAFTSAGATEVRLSPWRTLYAPIPDRPKALALCTRAQEIGLIIEAGNPLRRVDACPGAPACRSTQRQTRMDARLLSQRLAEAGFSGHLHVSGCAKGCSRPAPADLTFVGDEHGYSIVRNGTARDAPSAWLNATEIDSALDIVAKIGSNRGHE